MNNITETITELAIKDTDQITIIQITDTHILDDGAPSFNNFDTTASLNKVIQQIKTKEKNTSAILLTGDLVHEATQTSYQKLADSLSSLTIPLYCLPGNHDNPEMMEYVMGTNGVDSSRLIKLGNWLIILLNSHFAGEHGGCLSKGELNFLKLSLKRHTKFNCMIALHHHPISINSSWMDSMILDNAAEFFDVLDQFKQVRAIIWGHIHQQFETERKNMKLLGTPSTCLQFKPGSDAFAVDDKTPAYRRIRLAKEGGVETSVVYL